ncbi:MAG: hypothetical protein ACJA1F_001117 [Paracoccaceae bacterium]|jgi:hypothetical protein
MMVLIVEVPLTTFAFEGSLAAQRRLANSVFAFASFGNIKRSGAAQSTGKTIRLRAGLFLLARGAISVRLP